MNPFGRRGGKTALLDAWRHVAGEVGGRVELDRRGKPHRMNVPHRGWLLVLDTYTQSTGESSSTYTRVRSLFARRGEAFKLRVTKRYFFHALASLVGIHPVSIGYDRVDRALWIRSDRPPLARSLLRGTALGQALLRTPVTLVVTRPGRRIRKVAGESVGEVQLLKSGRIRDVATLREMLQICMETLDGLERFGVASEDPVREVAI